MLRTNSGTEGPITLASTSRTHTKRLRVNAVADQRDHKVKRYRCSQRWQLTRLSLFVILAPMALGGCGPKVKMFHPVGPVSRIEEHLMYLSMILIAIVVIPTIALLWYMVRRFRDVPDNHAPYRPNNGGNAALEVVWWGIPIVIVAILGTATAKDAFVLTRPPTVAKPPLTIEVTSLNWKYLFQYPEQKIATVNYCNIPTNRPIRFILTANAPMGSFWVPELGGQEYTMPGMAMQLWLQADKSGTFYGHNANFTGVGYAHMKFFVKASPAANFDQWAQQVKTNAPPLTQAGYDQLSAPGLMKSTSYSSYPQGSFMKLVMREGGMYSQHDKAIFDEIH